MFGTANAVDGSIEGALGPTDDADVYRVVIAQGSTTLTAETVATNGLCIDRLVDTAVALFNDAGAELHFNDDISADNYCSRLERDALAAGTYFLRVTRSEDAPATSSFGYRLVVTLTAGSGSGSSSSGAATSNGGGGQESEPNNTYGTANAYAEPVVGTVSAASDVDIFWVDVQTAGTELTAETEAVTGLCIDQDTDTFLELVNANGDVVRSNDDISSTNYCSRLTEAGLPAGRYYVRVTRSPETSSGTPRYRLILTLQASGSSSSSSSTGSVSASSSGGPPTLESEPNNDAAHANPLTRNSPCSGQITPGTDVDVFAFALGGTEFVVLETAAVSGTCADGTTDTVLTLRDSDGIEVGDSDDIGVSNKCSRISRALGAGTYTVQISGTGMPGYVLTLTY
jgi:hypothetical protein